MRNQPHSPWVTKVTGGYSRRARSAARGRLKRNPSALFYNARVKTWDVLIVGGGIIGLSLSIDLRKRGANVLIVERGDPGREASHAAGGMLVDCPLETQAALQALASASAHMYPEFAYELEVESGMKVDLRDHGAIVFPPQEHAREWEMSFDRPEDQRASVAAERLDQTVGRRRTFEHGPHYRLSRYLAHSRGGVI